MKNRRQGSSSSKKSPLVNGNDGGGKWSAFPDRIGRNSGGTEETAKRKETIAGKPTQKSVSSRSEDTIYAWLARGNGP